MPVPRSSEAEAPVGAQSSPIAIRMLTSDDDLRACVALQKRTWGADYDEFVPPSILTVTQKIGGVAAGAFGKDGTMLGFVFGLPGVRGGRIIHWSDMLAVREDARDRGVGKRLKEFQREAARASGAVTMYWTYDPLVARNAHLNFNRLGATVDEYVENMYGDSSSDLHRGLGTDRFVVAWPLDGEPADGRLLAPLDDRTNPGEARVLNPDGCVPSSSELAAFAPSAVVRIEIPLDIMRLRDAAPGSAARWRASTRAAIQWALGGGYSVARFASDPARDRGWYVMTRDARTLR
jgi:predicted GNAT superfamily acetyltransferase